MKLRERSSPLDAPPLRYVSDSEEEEDEDEEAEEENEEEVEEETEEEEEENEEDEDSSQRSRRDHISSDEQNVVVVNHRRRKVQLRRKTEEPAISPDSETKRTMKKKEKDVMSMAGSLFRYAQPNVKNTNRDVCVLAPLGNLGIDSVVEDSDEDFMETRNSISKKNEENTNQEVEGEKTTVEVRRVNRARLGPKKSYREVSSDDGSEDEGTEIFGRPAQKSAKTLPVCTENEGAGFSVSSQKSSETPPDLSVFSFKQGRMELQGINKMYETKKTQVARKSSIPYKRRALKGPYSSEKSKMSDEKDGKCQEEEEEEYEEGMKEKVNNAIPCRQSRRLAERKEPVRCLRDESSGDEDDFDLSSDEAQPVVCCSKKIADKKEPVSDNINNKLFESNPLKISDETALSDIEIEKNDKLVESRSLKSHGIPAPKVEVDKYGLCTSDGSSGDRLVKRIGEVEKILSVQKRGSESAMLCVKEYGKCYRNVVLVNEKLLREKCPQLLRNFFRKLDELGRSDGNAGERENGHAFDPSYLKIARIYAEEERKNGRKYYLVKWCGLAYSESTWEAREDLIFEGDEDAISRFSAINSSYSRMNVPHSFWKLTFRDGRVLREYQEKGLEWMDHNFQNRLNCILADEMGLGKTMQAVSMLQNLRIKRRIKGPFLVIAPVSTLGHWQREVETLTDMNCVVFSGSAEDRDIIKEYEFYYPNTKRVKFHVLLTSFEILMKDQTFLCKHEWDYVVVDEAHRLKSKDSKTTRSLKQLTIRKGGLLLLTGTPVQNNMKEIFGLLNVLDPDQFDSESNFLFKYGDLKNASQVRDLQENILKPRLLRRLKEDVEKSIPLKEETIIWVELTKEQRCYYKAIMENRISDLLKGSQSSNMPNLRNVAMELRKLCNHPFLCNGLKEDLDSRLHHNKKILDHEKNEDTSNALCLASGKMLLLDKLLPMLKSSGHRVLIFSQFAIMLDILEDYLLLNNHSYERIDGSIRGSDRQAAIDRYSEKDSDTFIFLLSTRAGGLGITLTAADTCIIYDSDWNPQNDLQAMARCHRIGQKKDVRIYRLITRNTYEQHLFQCSSRKYGLDEAILGSMQEINHGSEYNENIENLLKKGAYSLLKDDGEAESAAFCAQNIEQILESRTEKRLIGGRGNNSFSVATFISNSDAGSDNLDENENPTQSWQDLLPEACSNALNAEKQEALPCGPRKRLRINYRERKGTLDHESSDDDYGNCKGRRPTAKTDHQEQIEDDGIKHWTEKELRQLENCLLRLGRNRYEQIMVEARVGHHNMEEVQCLCDVLIQLCQYFQSKSSVIPKNTVIEDTNVGSGTHQIKNSSTLKMEDDSSHCKNNGWDLVTFKNHHPNDIIASTSDKMQTIPVDVDKTMVSDTTSTQKQLPASACEMPIIPIYAQKVICSESFMNKLEKRAIRNLQVIQERDMLERIVLDGKIVPLSGRRQKKLPIWWSDMEDADLLLGAHKHGHRDFDKIRNDSTLCFSKRLESLKNETIRNAIQEECPLTTDEARSQIGNAEDVNAWPNDTILASRLKRLIQGLHALQTRTDIPKQHVPVSYSELPHPELKLSSTVHRQNCLKQDYGEAVVLPYSSTQELIQVPGTPLTELNRKDELNPSLESDFFSKTDHNRKASKNHGHEWPKIVDVPNSSSDSENDHIHSRIPKKHKSSVDPAVKHDVSMQDKSQESYGHCTNNSIHVSKHDVVWARGKENDNVLSARTMKEVEYGQNKFHMVSPPSAAKKMKPLLSATSCLNLKQGMDSPILKVNIEALKRKVNTNLSNKLSSKKIKNAGKQQTLLGFLSSKCEI